MYKKSGQSCFLLKFGFHMSGKSQTIGPFTFCRPSQILPMYRIIATSLSQRRLVYMWQEIGAQQCRGLVMSEIHGRRPRQCKFEFSFIRNHFRPSQKFGTRRENRNAPDLSPSIPNERGYLRFRVFISRQNLGQPGNRKIPGRLGFSRHMKTYWFFLAVFVYVLFRKL